MSILGLLLLLVLFGVIVYFVQRSQYIAQPFKWLIYGVLIVITILLLMSIFLPGTMSEIRDTQVPRID